MVRAHEDDGSREIRAVAKIKMEGKRPGGRPRLRWKDIVRKDKKVWKIREEWATITGRNEKVSGRPTIQGKVRR